jgi:hypothetical protein
VLTAEENVFKFLSISRLLEVGAGWVRFASRHRRQASACRR